MQMGVKAGKSLVVLVCVCLASVVAACLNSPAPPPGETFFVFQTLETVELRDGAVIFTQTVPRSVSVTGQWLADLLLPRGHVKIFGPQLTSFRGYWTQYDVRVPATWRFLANTGGCKGQFYTHPEPTPEFPLMRSAAVALDDRASFILECVPDPDKKIVVDLNSQTVDPDGNVISIQCCNTDILYGGQALSVFGSIRSSNHQYRLAYLGDGNLALYNSALSQIWSTNTAGSDYGRAVMQEDGNFVVYDAAGTPVWNSGTWGNPGAYVILQDDGNLVVYSPGGAPLWNSGTVGGAGGGTGPFTGRYKLDGAGGCYWDPNDSGPDQCLPDLIPGTGTDTQAPTITGQPGSQTVGAGTTVTFGSEAVGAPTPSAQWEVSGDGVSWAAVPGATDTTYSFVARTVDRGKRFRVVYTNSVGSAVSAAAVLNVTARTPADYDGDGRSDVGVFRPANATWYLLNSAAPERVITYGGNGDIPLAADFDGDGRTDIGIFRASSSWFEFMNSSTWTESLIIFGGVGDIPVPADYDGDGKADVAVFRPSTGTWYLRLSSTLEQRVIVYGGNGDVPVPGDYDGDGKADIAVFRPSTATWYLLNSSTGEQRVIVYGANGDVPVPADYDGDGKTDIGIFRESTSWFEFMNRRTWTGWLIIYGGRGDIPVVADYDGDGKADVAVFRPSTGTWYLLNSSTGEQRVVVYGTSGDVPVKR